MAQLVHLCKMFLVCLLFSKNHNDRLIILLLLYITNIEIYWIPEAGVNKSTILGDERYDLGIVNDSRNPLYLQGHFRDNYKSVKRRFSLSGLKGIYYCQIHAVVQILILSGYIIWSVCADWKYYIISIIFFIIWMCIGIFFLQLYAAYYRRILNKTLLRKSMNRKEWYPFIYKDYGAKFETVPRQYIYLCKKDLLAIVLHVSEGFDKIFSVKAPVTDDSYIYGEESEDSKSINIRMFLQIDQLFDVHLRTLNGIYQSMVEKYLLGISKEKEVIYIASQEDTFGINEYKKLRGNIEKQLELISELL